MTKVATEKLIATRANLVRAKSATKIKAKQKRVKLANGKTVVVEVFESNGKNPFDEAARLLSNISSDLKPCN